MTVASTSTPTVPEIEAGVTEVITGASLTSSAAMLTARSAVSLAPSGSVTVMVAVVSPAVVGVPVMLTVPSPLSVASRPAGRSVTSIVRSSPSSSVATTVTVASTATPSVPEIVAGVTEVMTGASLTLATVMVKESVSVPPLPSSASTVISNMPDSVGVPVIWPASASKVRPAGSIETETATSSPSSSEAVTAIGVIGSPSVALWSSTGASTGASLTLATVSVKSVSPARVPWSVAVTVTSYAPGRVGVPLIVPAP